MPLSCVRPGQGCTWWTGAALGSVPPLSAVPLLVEAVEDWWKCQRLTGCEEQFQALGWEVRTSALGARSGGLQALLLPRLTGGFTVVVDPESTPAQVDAAPALVRRWRLAHEYGHTFFYTRRPVPRRSRPPTVEEELFCDAFANALLGAAFWSVARAECLTIPTPSQEGIQFVG
jgi:hypothetical protein